MTHFNTLVFHSLVHIKKLNNVLALGLGSVFLGTTINPTYHTKVWTTAMNCINMAQKRL